MLVYVYMGSVSSDPLQALDIILRGSVANPFTFAFAIKAAILDKTISLPRTVCVG